MILGKLDFFFSTFFFDFFFDGRPSEANFFDGEPSGANFFVGAAVRVRPSVRPRPSASVRVSVMTPSIFGDPSNILAVGPVDFQGPHVY